MTEIRNGTEIIIRNREKMRMSIEQEQVTSI